MAEARQPKQENMQNGETLTRFYEDAYSREEREAARYGRWRALSAEGKAEHVIALCRQADIEPSSTLDVGCGDGALLCELRRRGFGGYLEGVEIAQAAVAIARGREEEIDAVNTYDGAHLPHSAKARDLGVLSHVLEHVPDPVALLRETARACSAVVVEVPLEDNLSARRASKRAHAAEVGHLRSLSRTAMRTVVAEAGLRVAGELEDPLPLAVQRFFATTPQAQVRAHLKWAARSGLHGLAAGTARQLFTVHYACLCVPLDANSP